jgi:hypothetical protein
MMRDPTKELRRVLELRAAVEAARVAHRRRLIRAKFSGTCDLCKEAVAVGDLVAWRVGAPVTHASCFKGEVAP